MSNEKSVTFYCKQIQLDEQITFQKILENLNHLTTEQRKQIEGNKTYILNNIDDYDGMYYGEIICYENNKIQGIIHDDEQNNNLRETHITTKDIQISNEFSSSDSEFINNRIIFGLSNNYLVVAPSTLKIDRFINYFKYLLETYYWQDKQNVKVFLLKDVYNKKLKDKLQTTHVKSIELGQGVQADVTTNHLKPYQFHQNSIIAKLNSLIGGEKYQFKNSLDDANLRVTVKIDYTNHTSTEGQKFLDDITTSFATFDEKQVKINFTDGTDFKFGNIRLKTKIKIKIMPNNSFDRMMLQHDMYLFLQQNIQ